MIRQSLSLPFQLQKSNLIQNIMMTTNPQFKTSPKNILNKKISKRRFTQLRNDNRQQSNAIKPAYLAQLLKQNQIKQLPRLYPFIRNQQLSVQFLQDITNITAKPFLIISAYLNKFQLNQLTESFFNYKLDFQNFSPSLLDKNFICLSVSLEQSIQINECKVLLLMYPQQGSLNPLSLAKSSASNEVFTRNQNNFEYIASYPNKTILNHSNIDMPPTPQLLANAFKLFFNLPQVFITNSTYLKTNCQSHLEQKNMNSLEQLLKFQQNLIILDKNNQLRKNKQNILDYLNGQNQIQSNQLKRGISHNYQDNIKQTDEDLGLNQNLHNHQLQSRKHLSRFWDVHLIQRIDQIQTIQTILKRSIKHNSFTISNISNRLFLYFLSILLKFYDNESIMGLQISINQYRKQLQKAYQYKLEHQMILPMHQMQILKFLTQQKNYFIWLAKRDSKLFNYIGQNKMKNHFGTQIESNNQRINRKSTLSETYTSDPFSLQQKLRQFIQEQEGQQYQLNNQLANQHNCYLMKQLYQQKIGKKLKQGYYSSQNLFQNAQNMAKINMIQSNKIQFKQNSSLFSNNNQNIAQQYQKQSIQLLQQDFIDLISCYKLQSFQVPSQLQTFNTFMSEIKNNLINQIVNQLNKKTIGNSKKQDQLEDQINMQKGVLITLQRQIKQLQNQRKTIQDRNQKHKNYIEELNKIKNKTDKKKKIRNIISLQERSSQSSKAYGQFHMKNSSYNVQYKTQIQKNKMKQSKTSPLKLKNSQYDYDRIESKRGLHTNDSKTQFKTFQIDQNQQRKRQKKCCCCQIM